MKLYKTVILHCDDDIRRSILKFVLTSHGYKVVSAGERGDAAIVVHGKTSASAVETIISGELDIPILCLLNKSREANPYPPCNMRWIVDASMAQVLDDLRTMLARKRGPRPRLVMQMLSQI